MSKPTSIRTQPWASFDKQPYSIISDDFVHEKLLTVKVNVKTKGTFNLKNQVTKKGDAYKTQGEIKLWFPVWNTRNGHLYFRSKNNQIKVHYDDGVKGLTLGKFENYNLYGSYQSDKNLKNIVLKAGANLLAQNFNVDNRVRVGLTQQGQTDVSSGIKVGYKKNNWTVDSYEIINWKTKALLNNALRIAYHKDNNDVYLRAENQTNRNFSGFNWASLDSYFTKFTLDFVRKVDQQTKIALEGQFTKSSFGKTSVVVQRNVPNRDLWLKLKLTSNKSVAFSAQSILNNYGKWTAGFEVSDLGKTNKARFGLQFDVNL